MIRTTNRVVALALAAPLAIASVSPQNPWHMKGAATILTMEECLRCHSGITAKAVVICTGTRCLYKNVHSLMGSYPPAGKSRQYAPRSAVEAAGCVLERGRITCLSCHDLTRPPPHLVREGDALCRICHLAM